MPYRHALKMEFLFSIKLNLKMMNIFGAVVVANRRETFRMTLKIRWSSLISLIYMFLIIMALFRIRHKILLLLFNSFFYPVPVNDMQNIQNMVHLF